jgi:hypothetical protein
MRRGRKPRADAQPFWNVRGTRRRQPVENAGKARTGKAAQRATNGDRRERAANHCAELSRWRSRVRVLSLPSLEAPASASFLVSCAGASILGGLVWNGVWNGGKISEEPVVELETRASELKLVSGPAGTRGYDDLRRGADREPLGRGLRPRSPRPTWRNG